MEYKVGLVYKATNTCPNLGFDDEVDAESKEEAESDYLDWLMENDAFSYENEILKHETAGELDIVSMRI